MPRGEEFPEPEALKREEYVTEHHKFWDDYSKHNWADAYEHIASQTSEGALAALGEANFQNCVRISVKAVGHTQESPKDVDQAVAVLCRACSVAKWSLGRVVGCIDHPKKKEVVEAFIKVAAPDFAAAEPGAQADQIMEMIDDQAEAYGFMVLTVVRACLAAGNQEEKALAVLEKYLKLHRPPDPYDGGDLLALWYALQWRKSGRTPKVVRKAALVLFKNHEMKIVVDDDGTEMDVGVSSWDEEVLKNETVPEIMRDWRLFSDAMCFLTDGAIGFEPIVVEGCWDVIPKAFNPIWDSKYKRCISHSNFSEKEFLKALQTWEEGYKEANGGESDIILFHLLFPALKPKEAKVDICVGGICTSLWHSAFKGRPAYQDEGLQWSHHHRVFWMFHETHHLYEGQFTKRFDFAELIKKTDHPMFNLDNWMEEFKGGNEFFPGEHWHGKSEFDWYVQCITKRLNTLADPPIQDYWTNWWGGKEVDAAGGYFDFVAEFHALWEAGSNENWEKVCELVESQLRPMCHKKLGEGNYRIVVTFAVRGLTLTGQALDGPVLSALKRGMDVLEYPEERAEELIANIPGDKKEELLRLYKESDKAQERPRQKLEQQSKPISIIDDHHQMWDAYREKDWQEVLEHVETQVTTEARERLGDQNYRNCFSMSFAAIGNGKVSPKDVEDAVELLRKGMELTGWPLSTFRDLLGQHPKMYQVLQPFVADDEEGEYHDFISEHHVLWEAGSKENWEKVCEVVDSQLRPMAYKRLGEPNYRNVVILGLRGLALSGRALEGPVLEALKKGMEVLGYPKERAKELVNGIGAEKEAELLRIYGEA